MVDASADPFLTLGVDPGASDADLRAAYRRLVQLHHPDHNAGSAESTRQFEAVQQAYARARVLRAEETGEPDLEARLADLEGELRSAQAARDAAARHAAACDAAARHAAARDAAARDAPRRGASGAGPVSGPQRPSDDELGYIKTEDSFSKILADAASELSEHLADGREHPVPKRLSDLIDELGAKLTGEPPSR